jgi:hypothetical protein
MRLFTPFSNFLKKPVSRPNGDDKNWNLLYITVYGFRTCYNSWPTKVYLPKRIIENLQQSGLSPEIFSKSDGTLKFVLSDKGLMAEDEIGNRFRYGKDRCINDPTDANVHDWLKSMSVN